MPSVAPRVGETVETIVNAVRDKTIVPAERLARNVGLVVLAGIVAFAIFTLFVILLVRVLTILTGEAWIAELALAGIFLALGAILWGLRKPSS